MDLLQQILLGCVIGFFVCFWWFGRRKQGQYVQQHELITLRAQKEQLEMQVQELRVDKRQQEKLLEERLHKLASAEAQFLEEKFHLRRVQEEEQELRERERDRLWSTFESTVQQHMRLLCEDKRIGLRGFDNTQLPVHFSGTWKPDMLVEVGASYVVFDAKMSRSNQLETYIKEQVKKTAQKVQGHQHIFPVIFFVVPTEHLSELRETVFHEEHMTFVVLSKEALFGVLYTLKLLSLQEMMEGVDPELRGTLVTVLALLLQHMDVQHAVYTLFAERGQEVRKKLSLLPEDIQEEVMQKRGQLRLGVPSQQAIKELMQRDR